MKNISLFLVAVLVLSFSAPCFAADEVVTDEVDGGSYGGAGISNAVFIPAKAGSCAVSGILWFVGMTLTGGTRYRMMGDFVSDACGGKWVIKGEDMDPKKDWFLVD